MEEVEKAILYSYDAAGAIDPGLKSQAIAFINRVKDSSPSILRFCFDLLSRTDHVPVQFWCLQTLHEIVSLRYASLDAAELAFLRESFLSVACSVSRVSAGPVFIKNKFAQAFVALLFFEYPSVWSSPFLDLMGHLSKGASVIDVFSRILVWLDEEVVSMEYPRSNEEIAVSGRIKDAMRAQCIPQIVAAWYEIVSVYRTSNPEVAATVLDTMRRYITWIDIGLIMNDVFVSLLFDTVLAAGLPEMVRASAAGCVGAIVMKRMEPKQKIVLLQTLRVERVFCLVAGDADSEFVSKLTALIISYAAEALDCAKREGSVDRKNAAMELLEEALPSVFYVMQNCEVDSVVNAVQFLSDYVSMLKSPTQKQLLHIGQILEVIKGQISYDPMYRNNLDLPDKIGKEEEDQMTEHRKEFFTLLRSVSRVAPDVTQLFIRNLLANALNSSESNVEDVEVALSMFYRLGEAISDEGMRTGVGHLKEMIPMLLGARFACHSHRMVALIFLETVTRYMKFVQENYQYVQHLLAVFLDDRGIHHPNASVCRRASYLFMRAVKLLKPHLIPFIDTILQSLQDTLVKFTSSDWSSKELIASSSEDGSHVFEAIGLLIGMEEVSLEKQSEYLSALLTPLCRQIEVLLTNTNVKELEESPARIASIQQIIMAINALSKGFSERLVSASRPAIGNMFKETLNVLLQILVIFPNLEPLRTKITSFLHRMVEILGVNVIPHLPMALEKLLAKSEPKEMVDFLVLINQLICKFNTSVTDILVEIFPAVASRLFDILPKNAFLCGPGSNTEEVRELQELQRTLYTFLHVLTTHDLSSVLLAPKSRHYLNAIMELLLFTSCNHKDIVVRKICVQIVVRLIKDWCTKYNGEEKVPGFQNFIVESFATNCCFFSVLDSSFNFRDANTLILFGEIVVAQKVMYEKFGQDFLVKFVSKGLSVAHCPQEFAEQYYEKLQGDDIKALKSFYQSLVENLRRQQNGSFVVR